jgi:hypothetical protein
VGEQGKINNKVERGVVLLLLLLLITRDTALLFSHSLGDGCLCQSGDRGKSKRETEECFVRPAASRAEHVSCSALLCSATLLTDHADHYLPTLCSTRQILYSVVDVNYREAVVVEYY